MKYLFLFLLLLPLTAGAADKKPLTWREVEERCGKLPVEKRKTYKLCVKAEERAKKLKLQDPNVDPWQGRKPKNPKTSAVALYGSYGFFGNANTLDLEIEKRWEHFGLGAFYSNQKFAALEDTLGTVKGSAFGVSGRYHFNPLWVVSSKNRFDPGVYLNLGLTSYDSEAQGKLPNYVYVGGGVDASYILLRLPAGGQLSGYGKVGMSYIYHSESMFLNMGSSVSLGLKLEF